MNDRGHLHDDYVGFFTEIYINDVAVLMLNSNERIKIWEEYEQNNANSYIIHIWYNGIFE